MFIFPEKKISLRHTIRYVFEYFNDCLQNYHLSSCLIKRKIMAESSNINEVPRRVSWSPLQHLHHNSHNIASSASQRIQDLQYYIVHGFSQSFGQGLINSSSHRLTHSHPRHHRFRPRVVSNNFHYETPPPAESNPENHHYIINMESQEPASDVSQQQQPPPPPSEAAISHPDQSEQHSANNHPSDNIPEMDVLRNTPEFHIFMTFVEKYIPFVFILFLKLIFDHKLGILVIMGLFVAFFHANIVVKREVSKQGKRHILRLGWVSLNLITCIVIMYTVLADKELAFALVFVAPYTSPITIWDVLWVVSVTDFVIRMMTILVKLFIIALPSRLVAFHKKGKHYLFMERTSQLYRTIAPMQHWLYFFSESYSGPSKIFGVVLSAAYLIFKCKSILHKAKVWKKAFVKILQSKTYGVAPSVSQIKEAGDSCPICQDDYKSPSMLQCKHIFCEDCVALWFDRERTCPICRAQIADDPSWRDGATSLTVQIF